jgi:hypothetical protein
MAEALLPERPRRRGVFVYKSDQPGNEDYMRGGERFSMTLFPDGRLVQRANCHIAVDPDVERDSVLTVDKTLRPIEAYVRIETGGQFTGSAWYHFNDSHGTCEAFTAQDGRVSYTENVPPGPFCFCSHAIVGDAWMIAAMAGTADNTRTETPLYTVTLNKQGATGPALATKPFGVERVGPETIKVPAGAFETVRYRCGAVPDGTALEDSDFQYNIWITDDVFKMAVLSMYPGKTRFELVDLETD